MKITTDLNRNQKYLLACSLGPDSMALFHYLVTESFDFEVVHVNYHILEQADDDEKGILNYAKKFNIKVHVLKTNIPDNVNEEDWARDVRYDYFGEVAKETGIKSVLVAHNEDDLIETYLLQKERNNVVSHFGLKSVMARLNYDVVRPLLKYKKSELLDYCKEHDVPYSIDPSNFDIKFKRNMYRNKVVINFSDEQRKEIICEIYEKNLKIEGFLNSHSKLFNKKYLKIDKKFFEEISNEDFYLLLIEFLKNKGIYSPISSGASFEIYKAIKSKKANRRYRLKDDLYLYFEYGILSIHGKQSDYLYKIEEPDLPGLFTINSNANNFDLVIKKFPVYIKNVDSSDTFQYDGKTIKVNREFISWKVPLSIRDIWPGIYNSDMALIYVPKYQKNKIDSNGLLKFNLNDIYE